MLLALADIKPEDQFDCCIIGAGPAGLTIARRLGKAGKRVLLVEGGDRQPTAESQDIYAGESVGDFFNALDINRLRYFGGSSGHWGGWCRPLDDADFAPRPDVKRPGWPIGRAQIDPYTKEASDILELAEFPKDEDIPEHGLKHIHFRFSTPVRFGDKFFAEIEKSPNIFLTLNSNLTGIECSNSAITGVKLCGYTGKDKLVRATHYVLAAGGIENSRLLLWANVQTNGQVVKEADTLGRYWMEHPQGQVGDVVMLGKLALDAKENGMAFYSPLPASMTNYKVLNCGLRIEPSPYHDQQKKIIADIMCVAPDFGRWVMEQMGRGLACGGRAWAAWEQQPRRENYIELGPDKDKLGIPRTVLHWSKSDLDKKTLRTGCRQFANYLAKANVGRMKIHDWVLNGTTQPVTVDYVSCHHMGGTRMAASADEGIVDGNCKVFGQDNLFIAGSSVFPSGGHANPTLTIVQLALRLGDHLTSLPNT